VFVDSPMATDATHIFLAHPEAHRIDLRRLENDGENPLKLPGLSFTRSSEESQAIDARKGPMIVVSASGMATGGRILHHLEAFLPDPRATVLFVGYQAAGTRGRLLLEGAKELKIYGEMVPVRAKIEQIDGFSAHADKDELLRWLSGFKKAPAMTFLVHGEGEALSSFAKAIRSRFTWKTEIPTLGEVFKF
jgi:metallo-beta-lactamase family protein